jgi:hypothetical protein
MVTDLDFGESFVKRTTSMLCATFMLCGTSVALAAAPTPAPKPIPAVAMKHTDSCASKASKWQRQECEGYTHSAPGDEYFGRMKMSYLGINNTFHDEAIRAGAYTTDPGIITKVNFADESLQAWSHKYPYDPQLARSYFLAIQMYEKIYTQSMQQKAWTYMHILTERFPATYFGKLVKVSLAKGFTEHWFAVAETCPTAAPKGAPVAQTSPDATPAPEMKPGQPKVDIISPACVPVPTAVPSSSP